MYENYWKVNAKPFENTADAQFYYPSDTHQGALLKLRYAVENSTGGALLTGAPGLGKTLVIQSLLRHLPDSVAPRINLVFPKMPTDQLLSFIADELSESRSDRSSRTIDESVRLIQSALEKNVEDGRRALLVVDESHLLAGERTLDTLRLLLNFESEGKPCLTLILAGQPSLLPVLDRHPGLEERMSVKCLLRPFTEDETSSYILHRFQQAGGNASAFEQDAISAIHAISHGVPRKINRLCDLALLIAFAEEHATITASQIESVSDELITVAPE